MTGRQQTQRGDLVAEPGDDREHVAQQAAAAAVAHVDEASLPPLPAADLSNVIPFARARRPGTEASTPPLTLAPGDRPAPALPAGRGYWQFALVACSLAVHGGLLAAFWEAPRPLASIGIEVVSVEIVVGANMPTAGLTPMPGNDEVEQKQIDAEQPVEQAAERRQATTDSPQEVPVAQRETAPEERPHEQFTLAAESKPVREQQPETKVAVAMVETPHAEIATALPREIAPEITATIVPPVPPKEEQPVAAKPPPKPPVKKKERAPERKRIAARTADERRQQRTAPSEEKVLQGGLGTGRSDRETNYRGIVSAHLVRHKRYPADAERNGDRGAATVAFSLDGSGRVTSVRLVRSSGHSSLDQEVQAMVRRASPFPAPPNGQPHRFDVPVRFAPPQ